MFIAYTTRRNKIVETAAHQTREDAARELFTKFPKLKACETAVAVLTACSPNNVWTTYGQRIEQIKRVNLPAKKATKREVLAMLNNLYMIMNTADHETKAEWMTCDLAGECGCAKLDDILKSNAFTDDDRAEFYSNL